MPALKKLIALAVVGDSSFRHLRAGRRPQGGHRAGEVRHRRRQGRPLARSHVSLGAGRRARSHLRGRVQQSRHRGTSRRGCSTRRSRRTRRRPSRPKNTVHQAEHRSPRKSTTGRTARTLASAALALAAGVGPDLHRGPGRDADPPEDRRLAVLAGLRRRVPAERVRGRRHEPRDRGACSAASSRTRAACASSRPTCCRWSTRPSPCQPRTSRRRARRPGPTRAAPR